MKNLSNKHIKDMKILKQIGPITQKHYGTVLKHVECKLAQMKVCLRLKFPRNFHNSFSLARYEIGPGKV